MKLRVLQVNSADSNGGAENVAHSLHLSLLRHGVDARMAVGQHRTRTLGITEIPNDDHRPSRLSQAINYLIPHPDFAPRHAEVIRSLRRRLQQVADPGFIMSLLRGHEYMNYPGSWSLLNSGEFSADIVHCHNLHGEYFDLRALPSLSAKTPTILTLHDAWLLSGHCAHSLGCERWRTGCGSCPDLSLYPALFRDGTAYNWQRKREILSSSRLFVSTPSQWLMDRVKQSHLAGSIEQARVIPNGIDLTVFSPGPQRESRERVRLPLGVPIILSVGARLRRNPWKDYATLTAAMAVVGGGTAGVKVIHLMVGDRTRDETSAGVRTIGRPYVADSGVMADYYRASDLFVHASKVDTFPNVILEALACGCPVVASAVGGIPEQVKALDNVGAPTDTDLQNADGVLIPSGDVDQLAYAISALLQQPKVLRRMSENAIIHARENFGLDKQTKAFLAWYSEILKDSASQAGELPTISAGTDHDLHT